MEIEIERKEEDSGDPVAAEINEVEIAFPRTKDFDDFYNEFKNRRYVQIKKKQKTEQGLFLFINNFYFY